MQPASSGGWYRYNWLFRFVLITCCGMTWGRVFITSELKCELRQVMQNTPSHSPCVSCSALEYQKHALRIEAHKVAQKCLHSGLHSMVPFTVSFHTIK